MYLLSELVLLRLTPKRTKFLILLIDRIQTGEKTRFLFSQGLSLCTSSRLAASLLAYAEEGP